MGLEQRILDDVLGAVPAGDRPGVGHEDSAVAANELIEGWVDPAAEELYESAV